MTNNPTESVDIDYLAQLARIEITQEEKERYTQQIKTTISYLKKLDALDVSGIEPTAHAFPIYNIWQEDISGSIFSNQEALSNAPAQKNNQICVHKIIDEA